MSSEHSLESPWWVKIAARFERLNSVSNPSPSLSDSDDDERQIDRWSRYAGSRGRWKRNLENQIANKGPDAASKKVRQGLLQWAYIAI